MPPSPVWRGGNVRQLENTCRWLTVMAAGQEVLIQDLPAELFEATVPESTAGHALPDSWATLLAQWADRALRSGHQNLLSEAQPEMERTLLTTALRHTRPQTGSGSPVGMGSKHPDAQAERAGNGVILLRCKVTN